MTNLELFKAIAEIEGKQVEVKYGKVYVVGTLFGKDYCKPYRKPYVPFSSYDNCELRDKYKVNIEYWTDDGAVLYILDEYTEERVCTVDAETNKDINLAVLKCIALSRGYEV